MSMKILMRFMYACLGYAAGSWVVLVGLGKVQWWNHVAVVVTAACVSALEVGRSREKARRKR